MITKAKLEDAVDHGLTDKTLADLLGAGFPAHLPDADEFPHVHVDHDLSLAIERMGATGVNVLPVVSRASLRRLMGVVTLHDVLQVYGVAKGTGEPATASLDPAVSNSLPTQRSD
jgi:CBS domain-containing protein